MAQPNDTAPNDTAQVEQLVVVSCSDKRLSIAVQALLRVLRDLISPKVASKVSDRDAKWNSQVRPVHHVWGFFGP